MWRGPGLPAACSRVVIRRRRGTRFDLIVLDCPRTSGAALGTLLERTRAALAPGGRVWIIEAYEALERARERIVEHPLARLRRLMATAGLSCERLMPLEADGEHVLAASAHAAAPAIHQAPGAA